MTALAAVRLCTEVLPRPAGNGSHIFRNLFYRKVRKNMKFNPLKFCGKLPKHLKAQKLVLRNFVQRIMSKCGRQIMSTLSTNIRDIKQQQQVRSSSIGADNMA